MLMMIFFDQVICLKLKLQKNLIKLIFLKKVPTFKKYWEIVWVRLEINKIVHKVNYKIVLNYKQIQVIPILMIVCIIFKKILMIV